MLVKYAKRENYLETVASIEEKSKPSIHAPWLSAQICANTSHGLDILSRCIKRCHITKTVIHRPYNDICTACWYDDYGHLLYVRHSVLYDDIPQIGSVLVVKYIDDDYNDDIITSMLNATKMNMTQLAAYFGIPYKTMQNWSGGCNAPADYLIELMVYKLQHEGLWDENIEPVVK